jgi:hypothetical protein
MKRWLAVSVLSALVALSTLAGVHAQGVTQPFTYQGFLREGGAPLNNPSQSMRFRIYNALAGGTMLWDSGALTVNVSNGLFTVQLNPPASIWTGADRFLEIQVGTTTLTPRVRIGATPYANTATLLNMFQSGHNNPDRMVISHSPTATNWGLMYRDMDDSFHFISSAPIFGSWTQVRIGLGDGNVGIGTASPATRLDILGGNWDTASTEGDLRIGDTTYRLKIGVATGGGGAGHATIAAQGGVNALSLGAGTTLGTQRTLTILGTGNVGIGTTSPASKLHVQYASGQAGISSRGPSGDTWLPFIDGNAYIAGANIIFRDNTNAERMRITGAGDVGIGTTAPAAKLDVNGTARVKVLEITGADLAEKFPTTETLEPGTVVEIDPDNPGHLRKAQGAYNKRVAGVVAGANGLSKGIILGNLEGSENHTPIAISGRVWVYADAAHEAIEPGDLLTTSDTPGYAMKASDPSRAHGAVLGKAMTRLEKGKTGMVLVLVNLQ